MWDVETVECRTYRSAVLILFRRQSKNHLARWHRRSGFFQPPHCFICCQFLQLRFIWKASAAFICVWHPKRNLLLSTAVLFKAGPGVNRRVRVRGIYNAVNDWSSLSLGPYPKVGRFCSAVWRLLRFELFLFFCSVVFKLEYASPARSSCTFKANCQRSQQTHLKNVFPLWIIRLPASLLGSSL